MKLAPDTMELARSLNRCPGLLTKLQQTRSSLLSLQKQDTDNRILYQLLSRQNQLLQHQLSLLDTCWQKRFLDCQPSLMWLTEEHENLNQQIQTHCHLVSWLRGNDDSNGGPNNSMPLPKSPQPEPRGQSSNASPVPDLGFN